MKAHSLSFPPAYLSWPFVTAAGMLVISAIARGQGTISFNAYSYWSGTNYTESGMRFRVVVPTPGLYDDIGIAGPVSPGANIPYNDTPYMSFYRFYSADDYVAFTLTNGSTFGLTSVQLADLNSPSYSLLPISFVGFKFDGTTVTNTFTTPANGADHMLSYQFGPSFASGLSSVDILAPRWAMDNLVFTVPEPSAVALIALGLLGLATQRRGGHA